MINTLYFKSPLYRTIFEKKISLNLQILSDERSNYKSNLYRFLRRFSFTIA